MPDLTFTTNISGEGETEFEVRSHPLSDLIQEADFVSTFYLSITGKKPDLSQKKLLNAVLVASMDHGIMPASMFVPRAVASSGNDIITSMASSLLALGPYHGGAVSGAMELMHQIDQMGPNVEESIEQLVAEYRTTKKRIPGMGHRKYTDRDPRAQQLFRLAHTEGLNAHYIHMAEMIEMTLEREVGRKLPINIDGALAAILLTLNFPPIAGNAVFALARVAGSIAHIIEEQQSGEWVRRLPEEDIKYTG